MAERNVGNLFTGIFLYEVSIDAKNICCSAINKEYFSTTFPRQHIPHLSPFEEDVNEKILKLDTEMTLLFGELHTDRWLDNKPDTVSGST